MNGGDGGPSSLHEVGDEYILVDTHRDYHPIKLRVGLWWKRHQGGPRFIVTDQGPLASDGNRDDEQRGNYDEDDQQCDSELGETYFIFIGDGICSLE